MPNLEVTVRATELEMVKDAMQVLKDMIDDNRIPLNVREEYMDRFNQVMENHQRE